MSSTRLPGKVLRRAKGKPVLEFLIERLAHCSFLSGIVVATSIDPSDDPIESYCASSVVPCFRGPLGDVAHRFVTVVETTECPAFVRISADSPWIDPAVVDWAVTLFEENECDLVSNVHPRSFPPGQSVEVVRSRTFVEAYPRFRDEYDREHVTTFLYARENEYAIHNFTSTETWDATRLTIDTPEDWQRFTRVVDHLGPPYWKHSLAQVMDAYRSLQIRSA